MSLQLNVRRGSQTPRVCNYPPYNFTAAPEVVDHAKTARLFLDPWQEFVLTHGLGQHIVIENGVPVTGDWTAKKNSVWVPRQNGKGGIIEALELAWLFLDGMKVDEITHSAHEHKTSKKAYERMERLIRRTPAWHKQVLRYRQANGERMIVLKDGRKLEYHTRSDTAVRGFSSPRLILDEAQELTEDQMAAILPTVSAMENWQVWFFGTPPRQPDAWAYGLRQDGENGEARLAHFDWGADLDLTKVEDRQKALDLDLAYACNPALGIRIQIETVIDEQKPSGLGSKYGQERLGAWQPRKDSAGVIDLQVWATLQDVLSKREGDVAVAVDVSAMRDFAAITVYGRRDDGLGHGQLVDYRPGTDWLIPRLIDIKRVLDPIAIGMGPGTYESMKRELTDAKFYSPDHLPEKIAKERKDEVPLRGDVLVAGGSEMAAACGQIIDAVRQRSFRVIPAMQLDEAVAGAKVRQTGDAMAWVRKDSATDICPISSLTLARYAFEARSWLFANTETKTSEPFFAWA